jgi:hypothetical protein
MIRSFAIITHGPQKTKKRIIRDMTHNKTCRPGFDQRMSKDEINACPMERWTGPVNVVRTKAELASAMDKLAGHNLLGFDTETRPAYTKGESYPPSLLQLANEKEVFIFQLKQLGLAKPLREILANPKVIKDQKPRPPGPGRRTPGLSHLQGGTNLQLGQGCACPPSNPICSHRRLGGTRTLPGPGTNHGAGRRMSNRQSNNPLHGITLEMILTRLVAQYGWHRLGKLITINCFTKTPSIKSSLKFLRKTPWAREKVENLYLRTTFAKTILQNELK